MDPYEEAIDRLRRLGGDAFVAEVVDGFLATAARRLDEARRGLEEGDLDRVGFAMHSLKSGAGNLGLTALRGLADELERAAEAGECARAGELMEDVRGAVAGAEAELDVLRARLGGAAGGRG